MTVVIHSKEFQNETWNLSVTVELEDGARSGSQQIIAPENATEDELKEAVASLYA